jgi:hypothetical protein
MTFRDDHDAALARAAALEDEVERTRAERDKLAARVRELETRKPEPRRERKPKPPRPERPRTPFRVWLGEHWPAVLSIALTTAVFVPMFVVDCGDDRAIAEWDERHAAHRYHERRWKAVIGLEKCMQRGAYEIVFALSWPPDKVAPDDRRDWQDANRALGRCDVKPLLDDPATLPHVRLALLAWVDAQRAVEPAARAFDAYHDNYEYKLDGGAGAHTLWKPFRALVERQFEANARLRRDVFPALRDEVRALHRAHEAQVGRDATWWRGELWLALVELTDRAFAISGAYRGREPDLARAARELQLPMQRFVARSLEAPTEIRALVLRHDYITQPIAAGVPPRSEHPLLDMVRAYDALFEGDHVLASPPHPGQRPERHGD